MGRCFCGFKKQTAITLIALIITIIVLLILAGVVLNTVLGDEGIIRKSQVATQKTNYKSAKEIVQMKLLEIQTNCVDEGKRYTIKEIATQMKDDEEILIEKYYNGETAKVKDGIEENLVNLKGIVVSVDSYESYRKYKFLIGESGQIDGVLEGEISEGTQEEEFKKLEEFEEQNFGQTVEETEKIEISYEKKSINEDGTEVNLLIIVTASQGIEEITKPDGTVINGEGQTKKAIDFTAKVDTDYKFKVKGKGGTIKEIIINVNNATEINTIEDLEEIKLNLGLNYELKRDLDFKKRESYRTQERFDYYNKDGNSWQPLGNETTRFTGKFNGANHSIKNLYINDSTNTSVGLFGVVGVNNMNIKNLKLENVDITANVASYVGGIVGRAYGSDCSTENPCSIENCSVTGNITSKKGCVGGIAGQFYSHYACSIENISPSEGIIGCINYAKIDASAGDGVGGIVGYLLCPLRYTEGWGSAIRKCINYGEILASSRYGVGGIMGQIDYGTLVSECANLGSVKTKEENNNEPYYGGICGLDYSWVHDKIEFCYNGGTVSANTNNVGGICGDITSNNTLANCFNVGDVTGKQNVGGIIGTGASGAELKNNYFLRGKVNGETITSNIEGVTESSEDDIKNLIKKEPFSNYFVEDKTPNINNGFPIFNWQ